MSFLLVAMLCLASLAARAEPANERARLEAERQAIAQRFSQEEQACRQRFAITGCLEDVRVRRREALAPVRERELNLADLERQQRAAARRLQVAAKMQAAAGPAAAASDPVPEVRQAPAPGRAASASYPPRVSNDAAREAAAAERARVGARKLAEIEAGKRRVADRVAARASEGKPVQPLPPLPAQGASRPGR